MAGTNCSAFAGARFQTSVRCALQGNGSAHFPARPPHRASLVQPGITFRDSELIKKDKIIPCTTDRPVREYLCHASRSRSAARLRRRHTVAQSRQWRRWFAREFSYMPVLIPHAELATRVPRFDDAITRRVPRQSEALQSMRTYLRVLVKGCFSREGHQTIGEHIVDLAALAITSHGALGESSLSAVAAAHTRAIFDCITSHYSDPELSVPKVAQRLGISPRYLQRLLEKSGTSFTGHLAEVRLKYASRSLQHRPKAMSGFATLHCRLAFPIFRTSTDFSVLALAICRRASAQILVWAAQRPYSHSSDRLTPIDRAVAPSPPIGLTNSMHLRHAPYTLWALSVIVSPANNGCVGA